MEREQEDFQFLGAFSIFKESFKLIFTWRKIFMKITLALIFPLSCIFLAHYGLSKFLSNKIINNLTTINEAQVNSPTYTKVSNSISSEWTMYWLFMAVYFVFSLVFSLLSVSAVVYTIACIYTGKEPTFKRVMSVVPKVWKRLMITFLCNFCIIFVYTFVFVLVTLLIVRIIMASTISPKSVGAQVGLAILVTICLILYLVGYIYVHIIWQLANVISIMEKNCGFQAMAKSKALIKGKMGTAIGIFFLLVLCSFPYYFSSKQLGDIDGGSLIVGIGEKIFYGVLSLVLLTFIFLLTLVVQTVFYFVCKSYHHENIDKSSLADHLEAYLGEYVPLNVKDVEIGHLRE